MSFSVHPVLIIAAVGALAGVFFLVQASNSKTVSGKFSSGLVSLLCFAPGIFLLLMLKPELIDARFRTYKAFYRDIEIGMKREDLDALLERRYPAGGERQRPKLMNNAADAVGYFMNPEESTEPNCEGIFLKLKDGRVTEKQYSAD